MVVVTCLVVGLVDLVEKVGGEGVGLVAASTVLGIMVLVTQEAGEGDCSAGSFQYGIVLASLLGRGGGGGGGGVEERGGGGVNCTLLALVQSLSRLSRPEFAVSTLAE